MPSVAVKAYMLSGLRGYTTAYGKSYYNWADEKASRILRYLKFTYKRGLPLDLQDMAEAIYIEKLLGIGTLNHYRYPKIMWKPIKSAFTNHKPSPFIKSFLNYLINWLKANGYVNQENKVIKIPSLEELVKLCTFQPDP